MDQWLAVADTIMNVKLPLKTGKLVTAEKLLLLKKDFLPCSLQDNRPPCTFNEQRTSGNVQCVL
jgi:hypothetical protein